MAVSRTKQRKVFTERNVQRASENIRSVAKINKDVSVHTLRHFLAIRMLEGGTDLRYIQELLGYSSSETTKIYTHVTKKNLPNI